MNLNRYIIMKVMELSSLNSLSYYLLLWLEIELLNLKENLELRTYLNIYIDIGKNILKINAIS